MKVWNVAPIVRVGPSWFGDIPGGIQRPASAMQSALYSRQMRDEEKSQPHNLIGP